MDASFLLDGPAPVVAARVGAFYGTIVGLDRETAAQ